MDMLLLLLGCWRRREGIRVFQNEGFFFPLFRSEKNFPSPFLFSFFSFSYFFSFLFFL